MTRGLLSVLILLSALSCRRPQPEAGAAFFAGKTISYIVGTRPGGGYDTYARLIAKYMERHLPGTKIVVRNLPGAQHILAVNDLATAVPDGLTIGTFTIGLIYSQLTAAPGVRFDLEKLSWIGKAASEPRTLVVGATSGFMSVDDLRHASAPVRIAVGAAGSPSYFASQLVAEALGFRAQMMTGFEEDEAVLATLRGDVVGGLSSPTSVEPMRHQGLVRLLMRIGGGADVDASLPEASALATSPLGRSMMTFARVQSDLGRVTAAPPGLPADRLGVLRGAYSAALADPGLREELSRLAFPVDPLDGDAVARRVSEGLHPPAEVLSWLRATAHQ